MKKTPKTLWWLDTGIFPATVLFIKGFSYDETKRLLKRKKAGGWLGAFEQAIKEHPSEDGCWANKMVMEDKKTKETVTYFFIKIGTFDFKKDYDYCKLAHEILHICQFFLPDVLDRNDEWEAEAYLHTHLMKQCLKALRDGK